MRSSTLSGPRPAGNGHDQGQTPSLSPAWQAEPRNNLAVLIVSKSIPYCTDLWLDTSSNCWPRDKHLFAEVFAVCSSIQTDDPLLWSGRLTPNARAATVRENRGHCLNFYEDTHSLKQCSHLFTNIGCLYLYQGQLGNDGEVYGRWQACMDRYRREEKSLRSNKKTDEQNHRRRGNSRGPHQIQGQPSTQNDGSTHTRNKVTRSLSLVTTVESPPRPPLPLLPSPLASVTVPLTTLAETRTCVSQAPSALATDKTVFVQSFRPVFLTRRRTAVPRSRLSRLESIPPWRYQNMPPASSVVSVLSATTRLPRRLRFTMDITP